MAWWRWSIYSDEHINPDELSEDDSLFLSLSLSDEELEFFPRTRQWIKSIHQGLATVQCIFMLWAPSAWRTLSLACTEQKTRLNLFRVMNTVTICAFVVVAVKLTFLNIDVNLIWRLRLSNLRNETRNERSVLTLRTCMASHSSFKAGQLICDTRNPYIHDFIWNENQISCGLTMAKVEFPR